MTWFIQSSRVHHSLKGDGSAPSAQSAVPWLFIRGYLSRSDRVSWLMDFRLRAPARVPRSIPTNSDQEHVKTASRCQVIGRLRRPKKCENRLRPICGRPRALTRRSAGCRPIPSNSEQIRPSTAYYGKKCENVFSTWDFLGQWSVATLTIASILARPWKANVLFLWIFGG